MKKMKVLIISMIALCIGGGSMQPRHEDLVVQRRVIDDLNALLAKEKDELAGKVTTSGAIDVTQQELSVHGLGR
ncbi:MAG: hypothetical protein ACRCTE_00430 [Cellulosilyticaceae bacterium]